MIPDIGANPGSLTSALALPLNKKARTKIPKSFFIISAPGFIFKLVSRSTRVYLQQLWEQKNDAY